MIKFINDPSVTSNHTEFAKRAARFAGLVTGATIVVLLSTGCTTKNYVRSQAGPLIQQTNELDASTAQTHRDIVNTDQRATQGIAGAQQAVDAADAHAQTAGQAADRANGTAQEAYNRVDSLSGVVAGLDTYKPLADVSVTFGFDKSTLTRKDKEQLDQVASALQSKQHFILSLTGGTDSTGDAQYNYKLSQKRADAVAYYLQTKYNIPPHKFYMVGIGKDKEVASNRTASGRAENRRVEVKVLSNMQDENAPATSSTQGNTQGSQQPVASSTNPS